MGYRLCYIHSYNVARIPTMGWTTNPSSHLAAGEGSWVPGSQGPRSLRHTDEQRVGIDVPFRWGFGTHITSHQSYLLVIYIPKTWVMWNITGHQSQFPDESFDPGIFKAARSGHGKEPPHLWPCFARRFGLEISKKWHVRIWCHSHRHTIAAITSTTVVYACMIICYM